MNTQNNNNLSLSVLPTPIVQRICDQGLSKQDVINLSRVNYRYYTNTIFSVLREKKYGEVQKIIHSLEHVLPKQVYPTQSASLSVLSRRVEEHSYMPIDQIRKHLDPSAPRVVGIYDTLFGFVNSIKRDAAEILSRIPNYEDVVQSNGELSQEIVTASKIYREITKWVQGNPNEGRKIANLLKVFENFAKISSHYMNFAFDCAKRPHSFSRTDCIEMYARLHQIMTAVFRKFDEAKMIYAITTGLIEGLKKTIPHSALQADSNACYRIISHMEAYQKDFSKALVMAQQIEPDTEMSLTREQAYATIANCAAYYGDFAFGFQIAQKYLKDEAMRNRVYSRVAHHAIVDGCDNAVFPVIEAISDPSIRTSVIQKLVETICKKTTTTEFNEAFDQVVSCVASMEHGLNKTNLFVAMFRTLCAKNNIVDVIVRNKALAIEDYVSKVQVLRALIDIAASTGQFETARTIIAEHLPGNSNKGEMYLLLVEKLLEVGNRDVHASFIILDTMAHPMMRNMQQQALMLFIQDKIQMGIRMSSTLFFDYAIQLTLEHAIMPYRERALAEIMVGMAKKEVTEAITKAKSLQNPLENPDRDRALKALALHIAGTGDRELAAQVALLISEPSKYPVLEQIYGIGQNH